MISVRSICAVLCIAVVLPGAAVAEENPSFRFSRPIQVEGPDQEDVFSVPLDGDVCAATRDSFPDLRVLDADDRLIPFLIRRVSETRTETVRKSWTASNPVLQPLDSGGMEIRIVLNPENPSPQGLSIVTPLQNFEQRISVFAINSGTESTLVDEALIFDYSEFMDVRRTDVALPPTSSREFRIVIDALTSDHESQLMELTRSFQDEGQGSRKEKTTIQRRPFRIDRIDLWIERAEKDVHADILQPSSVTDLKVTHDSESKQTFVTFTTRREPLTELRIVTNSRNFSRHAALQVEDDASSGSKWHTIAETAISQFQLRDFREQHLTISLPETRARHMQIVLDNRDSPQLSIDGIEGFGHQYEVVFLGFPGRGVRLVYGSDNALPPEHDTVALTTALAKRIRPVPATLGTPLAITDFATRQPLDVKSLLNNPLAIGLVIVVLVIILAWGLYQASRRIDQLPPGSDD